VFSKIGVLSINIQGIDVNKLTTGNMKFIFILFLNRRNRCMKNNRLIREKIQNIMVNWFIITNTGFLEISLRE